MLPCKIRLLPYECAPLYDCYFFHDFSKYKSLKKQYSQIKAKYDRRIERFLKNIAEPTLFVRYINNENKLSNGKSVELDYIEKNKEYILRVLRSYNSKNDIIFIANNDILDSKIINIYKIKPDDTVSRSPILNNYELYPKFSRIKTQHQQANIERYLKKSRKKNNIFLKYYKKGVKLLKLIFLKPYHHNLTK